MNLEMISIFLAICASLLTILAFITGRSARKNAKDIGIKGNGNSIRSSNNNVNIINKVYYSTVNVAFAPSQRQINNVSKEKNNFSKDEENISLLFLFFIVVILGTIVQKYFIITISMIFIFFIFRYIRFNRVLVLILRSSTKDILSNNKIIGIHFVQLIQVLVLCSLVFLPLPNNFQNVVNYVGFDIGYISGLTTFIEWFVDIIKYLFIVDGINSGIYFFSRSGGILVLVMSLILTTSTKTNNLPLKDRGDFTNVFSSIKLITPMVLVVLISVIMLFPWYSHEMYNSIQEPFVEWVNS